MDWNGLLNLEDPQRNLLMQVGLGLLAGNQSGNAAAGAMRGFQNAQELVNAQQRQKAMQEEMAMRQEELGMRRTEYDRQIKQQKEQDDAIASLASKNPQFAELYRLDPKSAIKAAFPVAQDYGQNARIGVNPKTGKPEYVQFSSNGQPIFTGIVPTDNELNIAKFIDQTNRDPSSYFGQGNTQPQPTQNNASGGVPASPSAIPTNNFTTPYPVTWSGQTATDVKEGTSPNMQLRNPANPNLPPKTQRELAQKQAEAQIDVSKEQALAPIKTKQAADEEAAKLAAKTDQQAKIDLPDAIAKGNETIRLLDELVTHPGFEAAVGTSSLFDPRNYIPGSDAKGFKSRLNQLAGQTFLQAYQSLKGGGQITEVEGAKAEKALARMDVATSETEFKQAVKDFKDSIQKGVNRAKMRAGKSATTASTATPSSNEIVVDW